MVGSAEIRARLSQLNSAARAPARAVLPAAAASPGLQSASSVGSVGSVDSPHAAAGAWLGGGALCGIGSAGAHTHGTVDTDAVLQVWMGVGHTCCCALCGVVQGLARMRTSAVDTGAVLQASVHTFVRLGMFHDDYNLIALASALIQRNPVAVEN